MMLLADAIANLCSRIRWWSWYASITLLKH